MLVEYEYYNTKPTSLPIYDNFEEIIKVNHKDNTITIKKLKDSWNSDEVEMLLESYRQYSWSHGSTKQALQDWIKENL